MKISFGQVIAHFVLLLSAIGIVTDAVAEIQMGVLTLKNGQELSGELRASKLRFETEIFTLPVPVSIEKIAGFADGKLDLVGIGPIGGRFVSGEFFISSPSGEVNQPATEVVAVSFEAEPSSPLMTEIQGANRSAAALQEPEATNSDESEIEGGGLESDGRGIAGTVQNKHEFPLEQRRKTPLQKAATTGNYRLVKNILENGADVNGVGGKYKSTALMSAAQRCYKDVVELLIRHGADVYATNSAGRTAYQIARSHQCKDIMLILKMAESPLTHTVQGNDGILKTLDTLSNHTSIDGVWTGKEQVFSKYKNSVGGSHFVKKETLIRLVINRGNDEYYEIIGDKRPKGELCHLVVESKDATHINGKCSKRRVELTLSKDDRLSYHTSYFNTIVGESEVRSILTRSNEEVKNSINPAFEGVDIKLNTCRYDYPEKKKDGRKTHIVGYFPENIDILNHKIAREIIYFVSNQALRICGPKSGPVSICIMAANKNKCLAGGVINESGHFAKYYNTAAKKAKELRQKQLAEQRKRQAEEQAILFKRKQLLSFLQNSEVEVVTDIEKLNTNPFVYENKTVVLEALFFDMIARTEGRFAHYKDFSPAFIIVSSIPVDRFTEKKEVLLVGRVLGNTWETPTGIQALLPHLEFIDAYDKKYQYDDLQWALSKMPDYSDSEQPQWLRLLKNNKIIPWKGLAGIQVGMGEKAIPILLGDPTSKTHPSRELHGAHHYRYKGVSLHVYYNRNKPVKSFRLSDYNFNKYDHIPSIRGISIGSSEDELIKVFGKPLRTFEHYTCPNELDGGNRAMTYKYSGISFWVCDANKLIYLIDVP